MTHGFPCPYLNGEVELTAEREHHIAERHPDLLPDYYECLTEVLRDPDMIRRSQRAESATIFSKWFDTIRGGKHVVVVVMTDRPEKGRHWIATAYLARRLAGGGEIWRRS
ncbi:MAG: hypothetical protein C4293_04535 [Nitrospiraceae bacterium]